MRKIIVAGNWKMNKTLDEAVALAEGLKKELANLTRVETVLCPPFVSLKAVGDILTGSGMHLGAQNMHHAASGAFTGEISASMLRSIYCRYVILGHSERRQFFGETDATVNQKVRAAHAGGLKPIMCIGETLEEREAGITESVIDRQVRAGLEGLSSREVQDTVLAYEPVWAIGTGRTASPQQAQDVHAFIRSLIVQLHGEDVAEAVRIQYGGSMKPDNAKELLAQPDIDGGLIGGASLDVPSFAAIVRAGM